MVTRHVTRRDDRQQLLELLHENQITRTYHKQQFNSLPFTSKTNSTLCCLQITQLHCPTLVTDNSVTLIITLLTSGSAIAEGLHNTLYQLKSCQLLKECMKNCILKTSMMLSSLKIIHQNCHYLIGHISFPISDL